jgi:hypothetical protein
MPLVLARAASLGARGEDPRRLARACDPRDAAFAIPMRTAAARNAARRLLPYACTSDALRELRPNHPARISGKNM